MSVRPLKFTGVYFDGMSARKHQATLSLSPRQLALQLPDGRTLDWQYTDLILSSQGAGGLPPFQLEHPVQVAESHRLETLVVDDPLFLKTLRDISAVSLHATLRPEGSGKYVVLALAFLAVPVFLYGLWTVAIPKLSDQVAMQVPVAWEEKLGDRVLQSLPKIIAPTSQPAQEQALNAIARRLLSSVPDQPYNIRIHISSFDMVNAVAFPGGHILVFQGLLNQSETPEELAGVLAHEIEHVLLRHSTRNIISSLASSVLLTLFTGDMNGTMDVVLNVAGELEGLAHSRDMEREADSRGMDMVLAANIDPAGMVSMFEKIVRYEQVPTPKGESKKPKKSTESDDSLSWLEILSTHPAGQARVEQLKNKVAMIGKKSYTPLLPDQDWKALVHRKKDSETGEGESQEDPSAQQISF